MSEFDTFYDVYPRHEGRIAAQRAYIFARRTASATDILQGAERYRQHVQYRETQYIQKPANWLRDGGWMDEYDAPAVKEQFPDCDHTPRCNSKVWCAVLREREQAS